MPPVGIPQAHSNTHCFCSCMNYFTITAPQGTPSFGHPRGSSPVSQRWPSTYVSRSVLVQSNGKARQAFLIDTMAFIPHTTSLGLSCSSQLHLNLHVPRKGSSSKRFASYSKAARYSCVLREGLQDCLRLNSTARNMEYCKRLLWSVHKIL